jgi:chaperonin GroES
MKRIEKLQKYTTLINIVPELSQDKLDEIKQDAILEYNTSLSDMSDYIANWKRDIEAVCMISTRDKPFDGASDVVFPLCSNAVINLASKAFNAFFPDDDIYKAKIVGEDNGEVNTLDGEPMSNPETGEPVMINVGEKSKAGQRIALAMNYQVNQLIPNWKPETIQLLYGVISLGTMYRKEGYDAVKNRNYSKLIFPDKIIVNKNITSLEEGIYSEEFYLSKNEIQANINRGLFIDYDYDTNMQTSADGDFSIRLDNESVNTGKFKFIEQHTFIDLDGDGYKEPYNVIVDIGNQKVVRITTDFNQFGIQEQDGSIYNIERLVDLICYRCMPSFDGSFFGLGLPYFLKNINSSINTSINQLIDSMHLKIKGGGFVANDLNVRGGGLTLKMGEFKKVISLGGGSIADKFFTPPIPEPSPVMMALLDTMIGAGKDIGLLRDVLTGNIQANMAPTTFLGLAENAVTIENSIFKLLNESFIQEIKVRRRLNALYYPRELYHKITNSKPEEVYPTDDFDNEQVSIVLLTDASNITKSQKMAKAQIYDSLMQDPFYNGFELRKKKNESLGMPELNSIMSVPQPTPQADMILAQAENKKADAKIVDSQTQAIKISAEIEEKADKLNLLIADIKVKESQAIKNISEAISKQEKISLDRIKMETDALYKQQTDIENDTIEATNDTGMAEQPIDQTLS